ncbi:MAG: type II toxin-antitoxin system prevent-host-death family antitoxin [Candidatus Promineofilum sp.]|nr:type II toxin-antitoxin system prevent-host-death family antitoxin [Promineifilum sp.]
MEERQIGATELRQKLTDVIQAVKEEKVVYVVETFGRPQMAVISIENIAAGKRSIRSTLKPERARSAFGTGSDRLELDDEWLAHVRKPLYSDWK